MSETVHVGSSCNGTPLHTCLCVISLPHTAITAIKVKLLHAAGHTPSTSILLSIDGLTRESVEARTCQLARNACIAACVPLRHKTWFVVLCGCESEHELRGMMHPPNTHVPGACKQLHTTARQTNIYPRFGHSTALLDSMLSIQARMRQWLGITSEDRSLRIASTAHSMS